MFAEIRKFRAGLSAGPLTGVNWFQTAMGFSSDEQSKTLFPFKNN